MKPPHNGPVLSLGNSTSTAVSREIRTTWKANSISRPHPIYPVRSTYSATPTTTDFLNNSKVHHHIMAGTCCGTEWTEGLAAPFHILTRILRVQIDGWRLGIL